MSSNSNLTTMRRLVEQLKLEASVERIKTIGSRFSLHPRTDIFTAVLPYRACKLTTVQNATASSRKCDRSLNLTEELPLWKLGFVFLR
ncbi:hypothetical protein EOD39_19901 [Acipenser ruthenus]|uniref:G protein gamma domain-containing protein n=1 Tax=Acipenser ruthenus TaxID=7906 RepID=A0A444UWX2_ACIRT|nr:hypothetical protein EOD39_19901 [Acipenser ruthenus]